MRLGTCVTNPAVRDVTVFRQPFRHFQPRLSRPINSESAVADSSRRVLGKKPTTLENLEEFRPRLPQLERLQDRRPRRRPHKISLTNGEIPPRLGRCYGPQPCRTGRRICDGVILHFAESRPLCDWCPRLRPRRRQISRPRLQANRSHAAAPCGLRRPETAREHVPGFLGGSNHDGPISKYKPERMPPRSPRS